MENMPVIDHNRIIIDGQWVKRKIPPIFRDKLAWAENVKCPSLCPFACLAHPMVKDEKDENMYHKLCTLTVIGEGLVMKDEITGNV